MQATYMFTMQRIKKIKTKQKQKQKNPFLLPLLYFRIIITLIYI